MVELRNVTIVMASWFPGNCAEMIFEYAHSKTPILLLFYSSNFCCLLWEFYVCAVVYQGTIVVAGRARAVVIGVGSNTAMGSIRDAMLRTEDVSNVTLIFLLVYTFSKNWTMRFNFVLTLPSYCVATSMPICTLINCSLTPWFIWWLFCSQLKFSQYYRKQHRWRKSLMNLVLFWQRWSWSFQQVVSCCFNLPKLRNTITWKFSTEVTIDTFYVSTINRLMTLYNPSSI